MDSEHRKILERQHYSITGNASAVKTCTWTRKSIKGEGHCYKQKFYGIQSHRCCQISTTIGYCQNSCIFCWRPMEYTDTGDMPDADSPDDVIENSILGQRKLLSGLGGYEGIDRTRLKEAKEPMHFAISLSGEPFMYPYLDSLISKLHERGKTTFVVTNGLLPEKIAALESLPTQLYVSVDAPDEGLFRIIDNCQMPDGWKRLDQTLAMLPSLKTRTALRFTLIKGMNMVMPEKWAEIIRNAQPMFVEVKAYMYVGFSRQRMKMENMPLHPEVKEFAQRICDHSGYRMIDEKADSRVVLLMKEDKPERVMVCQAKTDHYWSQASSVLAPGARVGFCDPDYSTASGPPVQERRNNQI